MALFFRQNPFLHVIIPLLLGIWLALKIPEEIAGILYWISLGIFIFYIILNSRKSLIRNYNLRWIFPLLFYCFVIISAVCLTRNRLPYKLDSNFSTEVSGIINNVSRSNNGSVYKISLTQCVFPGESNQKKSVNLLCFIPERMMLDSLIPGMVIYCKGDVLPLSSPGVPFQFDYGSYLYYSGYSATMFANRIQVPHNQCGSVYSEINQLRFRFQEIFRHDLTDSNVNGVMQSLVLGNRDDLDYDLKQLYIKSGAIHMLAVSGLHVGIVFLLLNYLFGFLKKKKTKIIKLFLVLIILWFYAWLTRFSPSVLRATIMFSIIQVGNEMNRKASVYNSLCISVFIILMINPLTIYHAGFWLSHLAVLGIVTFYDRINSLFIFSFIGWRWMWSIISVSISAQLTTFPLLLKLFEGFPVYFILTNMLILPLIPVILIGGLIILFIPTANILYQITTSVINDLVYYMNSVVQGISGLPYAYPTGFSLTIIEMLILFIAIFLIYQYWVQHKPSLILAGQFCFLTFLISIGLRYYTSGNNKIVSCYSRDRKHIINIVDNHCSYSFLSERVKPKDLDFMFECYWNRNFVNKRSTFYLDSLMKDSPILVIKKNGWSLGVLKPEIKANTSRIMNEITKSNEILKVNLLIYLGEFNNDDQILKLIKRDELICFSNYDLSNRNFNSDRNSDYHQRFISMKQINFYQTKLN